MADTRSSAGNSAGDLAGNVPVWKFGAAVLDEAARELRVAGEIQELDAKQFTFSYTAPGAVPNTLVQAFDRYTALIAPHRSSPTAAGASGALPWCIPGTRHAPAGVCVAEPKPSSLPALTSILKLLFVLAVHGAASKDQPPPSVGISMAPQPLVAI